MTVVSEYLQGERAGFFGANKVNLTSDSTADLGGSVALEIVEALRYQEMSDALQQQIGGEPNDRIIRLSVRYLLRDLEEKLQAPTACKAARIFI